MQTKKRKKERERNEENDRAKIERKNQRHQTDGETER